MKKICISFIAGLTIGMLIAPAKGAATRRKIVDKFRDFTDDLTDEAEQLQKSGNKLLGRVKDNIRDLAAEGGNEPSPV